MKSLSGLIFIFDYIYRTFSMEQIKELWYCLHVIIRQIFVFIKERFGQDYTSYLPEYSAFDEYAENSHLIQSTKQVLSENRTFLAVLLFVTIAYLITSKLANCDGEGIRPSISPYRERPGLYIDVTEPAEPNNNNTIYGLHNVNHPWGNDATRIQRFNSRRLRISRQRPKPYCIPKKNESHQSVYSVKSTLSHHSDTVQSKSKTFLPTSFSQLWLVRRTRSGHIYGKYPI